MGVPEKFGLAICYPWKIVSTFFEELQQIRGNHKTSMGMQ